MRWSEEIGSIVMALVVVLSLVAGFVAIGATVSPVAADQHTYDQAPDMDSEANFTINFPFPGDHYPGDQNEGNGSIEYFSSGADAYAELGAEEGIWANVIVISADWIDYTECTTDNTYVFGIDRGNNNSGVNIDEDLVQHRRDDNFRDDGLDVYFYNWDDLGGDPPYLAPEDAIVSAQGWRSNGGPCLTLTSEPGWYQMQGFLNGSIANGGCTEEGNANCEPEDKEYVGVKVKTNYMYVCECDSEQEAREQLGPPPNEDPDPTPTETDDGSDDPTPTETDSSDDPTPTETESGDDPTPTPTEAQTDDGGGESQDTQTESDDDEVSGDEDDGNATPTPGEGPGFGPAAAILALLGAALLANRRR